MTASEKAVVKMDRQSIYINTRFLRFYAQRRSAMTAALTNGGQAEASYRNGRTWQGSISTSCSASRVSGQKAISPVSGQSHVKTRKNMTQAASVIFEVYTEPCSLPLMFQ